MVDLKTSISVNVIVTILAVVIFILLVAYILTGGNLEKIAETLAAIIYSRIPGGEHLPAPSIGVG